MALARLALHRQRLVAGAAAHHAPRTGTRAWLPRCSASAPCDQISLGGFEGLVGHQRQMGLLGDHPLLASAVAGTTAGVLGLGEVEAFQTVRPV
jgi:hypothetical protein